MGGGEGLILESNEKGWVFVSNTGLLPFAPEVLFSATPSIRIFCDGKQLSVFKWAVLLKKCNNRRTFYWPMEHVDVMSFQGLVVSW